ncbi:hypothetical protein D9611_001886 [Ephemerocybe angulata]|uniref:Sodium/calcium exchanger membrane region domain-containing protein n=1 Tax=Ephemerocybe angulata TaxID=980116 RepID=A0A8H5FMB4_9AGAR|nr:hypothetical protein D9611_001886 [Tulosesus angulatus]
MPSVSAKLIFPLLLCLNVLTWSRSRYGQPTVNDGLLAGRPDLTTLFKRSYDEGLSALAGLDDQCRPLTTAPAEQCEHVQEFCTKSNTVLGITYLEGYYCTQPSVRPVVFAGLLVWLLFLFSTLGISASDFFTPNLASIAKLLGLDENVAGVTFLAFGNGSPDLFSTFSAMRAGSGGLAIGELVGAASFIVSCVVGSMCIIKPFHVHPRPFLRDVGFFTIAVALMLVILWDGTIQPWEAGLLIVLYVVYVVVVVAGSWWERRREHKRSVEALVRNEYQDEELFFETYTDHPSNRDSLTVGPPTPSARGRAISAPARPRIDIDFSRSRIHHTRSPTPVSAHAQLPSFSLIGALEFRDVVASLQREATTSSLNMFESPVTPYAGGHYHTHAHSIRRQRRVSGASSLGTATLAGDPLDDLSGNSTRAPPSPASTFGASTDADARRRQGLRPLDSSDYFSQQPMHASMPSILRTPASPTVSEHGEILYTPSRTQRFFRYVGQVLHTLFPTLHRLKDQSILGTIACVFAAPPVALLTLTLPVVVTHHEGEGHSPVDSVPKKRSPSRATDEPLIEFEEEGVERVLVAEDEVEDEMHYQMLYNKWLMAAQCVFGPLFCVFVLFSGQGKLQLWLLLGALLGGLTIGAIVIIVGGNGNNSSSKMVRCSMGFFVSMVWIMAIADEVVNVLQAFGTIFGLSDAIIGLTIFAMGNSLADLVANMSVAVFAPIMGFSACFGGPMLNILLGVGVTGTVIMQQTHQPYELALSHTLLVSSFGLLSLLGATLVFVPLNGYYLSRRWGILLVCSYVVIMATNVVVELKA